MVPLPKTVWNGCRAASLCLLSVWLAAGSPCHAGPGQNEPLADTIAPLEQLLAKIKAQQPGASILKLEQRTDDIEGEHLTYAVKLLRPDGRIAWMTFDAGTLELLESAGTSEEAAPQRRRRERRRHGW